MIGPSGAALLSPAPLVRSISACGGNPCQTPEQHPTRILYPVRSGGKRKNAPRAWACKCGRQRAFQ
eukprot:3248301-Pyramimonas_sp.AAC.1